MKSKLLLLAFGLMAVLCSAQTAVQLLPNPRFKGWDATGTVPLALGKVCTYQAGTTTPLATYTDSTGNTPNSNPVILNVAGEADIWFSATAAYKVTLLTAGTDSTCSTGSQIWSKDNISQKYFRFDGTNALTAIPDPAVALGEFWLSLTNPGFLKWSDASAIHTVVGADSTQTLTNKTLTSPTINTPTVTSPAVSGTETHSGQIQSTIATGTPPFTVASTTPVGNLSLGGGSGTSVKSANYSTDTNCASSAAPAVCGSAAAGSVVIGGSATTVTVNTSAVTANSEILVSRDDSLGARLSVTCNTQSSLVLGTPRATTRIAGTSFVITIDVGPTTTPMCINYSIVN